MTKTSHTPGPWTAKWSKYREGVFIVQAGMPSNRVLAQFDGDGYGPDGQSLADARLIAAAPCLLEALRFLADQAERTPGPTIAGIHEARAAIARATGAA